jgi:gas vesicle protein
MSYDTTRNDDPDEIRRDIEQTRGNLSRDVDTLAETVRPGNVARRQANKVSGGVSTLKERVMGKADDLTSTGQDALHTAGDTASSLPDTARSQTQGNPMAAGLIALGAGWLLGSLLPASAKEREAAAAVKERAQPLVEEAKEMAKDTADELKQPAQEAAQAVKDTATEGAETVKAQGQSTAGDVKSSAKDAKDTMSGDGPNPR